MKILHINTLSKGGAANAAIRLHHGLLEAGFESYFLTLSNEPNKITNHIVFPHFSKYGLSIAKRIMNKIGLRILSGVKRQKDYNKLNQKIECFSSPKTDFKLAEFINNELDIDIVNLHWAANFLDYAEFFSKIKKPVVWTLHDENPFSSYWHYSLDNIQTPAAMELHNFYIKAKESVIKTSNTPLEIVAPSRWLMEESIKSIIFSSLPHHHIENSVNTNAFCINTKTPESLKNFQHNDHDIIGLFICQSIDNKRKGMHLLIDVLKNLPKKLSIKFIAVGKVDNQTQNALPSNIFFTGEISNENELSRLYNYADFTIIPSLQDNLPNTMLESLCCGTPVLGTPAGGIPEVVNRNNYGMVAKDFEPESLAHIIESFCSKIKESNATSIASKAQKEFKMSVQTDAYAKLYKRLLS